MFLSPLLLISTLAIVEGGVLGERSHTTYATYYAGTVAEGACSFTDYTLPAGIYGTAVAAWDNSAHCGACLNVTGPAGNSIIAMVVDSCPSDTCSSRISLALFGDAFPNLASPELGIAQVTWSYTTCPIHTPLALHFNTDASSRLFSVQVVNADKAVASVQVSADGGVTWLPTARKQNNYFERAGTGAGLVDVRVVGVAGEKVVVKGVRVVAGKEVVAAGNF